MPTGFGSMPLTRFTAHIRAFMPSPSRSDGGPLRVSCTVSILIWVPVFCSNMSSTAVMSLLTASMSYCGRMRQSK
jgi:hypothetical protein